MNTTNKLTETEIIERVLQGEKSLYEIIIRRYNPYLYKMGRSYNFGHQDTQDLMQETFIDAYKGLSKFEGRSNFKTWIIRIMLNNCYRKMKKASYKRERPVEINDQAEPLFTSATNGNFDSMISKEAGRTIEMALTRIPEEYRMVFSLRELNALSVSETAQLLDISETNVKVRLNRAKAMLRREVEKTYSVADIFEFNLVYCDAIVETVMKEINKL